MLQPSDIPRFRGDESPEDAEEWFERLVACAGSFSDSGIFRLLFTKLSAGSSAWRWFEALDDTSKTSWMAFQQEFRSRWITSPQRDRDDAVWEDFRGHVLRDDVIFGEGFNNRDTIYNNISAWIDDHLRLANSTKHEDAILIDTTRNLLPPFVQAYLRVNATSPYPSIEAYCSAIRDIPPSYMDLEQIRRQIALKDQISTIESRVERISERVDQLLTVLDRRDIQVPGVPASPVPTNDSSNMVGNSNESISWEPCSPVTSVQSVAELSSGATSELTTPTVHPIQLPVASEGSVINPPDIQTPVEVEQSNVNDGAEGEQITLYRIPATWRKPTASISRKELIAITQRAINFIAAFSESFKASQVYSLQSAFAIYDSLVDGHNNKLKSITRYSISKDDYEPVLSGLLGFHGYCTYEEPSRITTSMGYWADIAASEQMYWTVVTPHQQSVTWHGGNSKSLKLKSSGESMMAGGLFSQRSTYDIHIGSARTILFMTLSIYLAECTGEAKYTEMSVLSANLAKTWMIDSSTTLVKECFINATTAVEQDGAIVSSHLTGIAIEGFSVLASVTGDESWRSLAIDIAVAAMRYGDWHSPDGILIVGSDGTPSENTDTKAFKGLLNRGLLVAYQRNRSNVVFCDMVRSYINVQCDAMLYLSRYRNSYGIDWRGPYTGPYFHSQIAAIDTLVAAIGVND